MLQFWPTNKSTSTLLHYTGRFRVRRVVQARILRKTNPDADYAMAVYNFLKKRSIKYNADAVFFSADAKCKISIGEPTFPLQQFLAGKKVIIGKNEVFKVADHDFSKLSIIPDAVLVHDIPENYEQITEDESEKELISSSKSSKGDWYAGKVYYSFKSMVLEGSTIRGVTEMGNVLENVYVDNETSIPKRFYLITNGGGDRNIVHLSVKKVTKQNHADGTNGKECRIHYTL